VNPVICLRLSRLRLEVVLLARHALRLALADNLLAEPLSREALLQQLEVLDNVPAALDDGILGCDGAVGRDAELEGRKERMRDLVCREDDVVVLEEALRQQVAKRVVFLVEGEDGRVRDACCVVGSVHAHGGALWGGLRVSSLYSTLDWPSSRRKSSNLFSGPSALCDTCLLSRWLSRSPQFGSCSTSAPILRFQEGAVTPSGSLMSSWWFAAVRRCRRGIARVVAVAGYVSVEGHFVVAGRGSRALDCGAWRDCAMRVNGVVVNSSHGESNRHTLREYPLDCA
jgi:hypothetical protein